MCTPNTSHITSHHNEYEMMKKEDGWDRKENKKKTKQNKTKNYFVNSSSRDS
jgi:hypothetical protein